MRASTHLYLHLDQATVVANRLPNDRDGQLLLGDIHADNDYTILSAEDPEIFDRIATAAAAAADRMRVARAAAVAELDALLGGAS
jgi:hypothetical protein